MKKIVYTSGSWDLFHVGHLNVLEKSKALGEVLVVGVSTDELISDYKGLPPIIPYEERKRIVEAISFVDVVVKQTKLTEIAQLQEHNVNIVTIGDDWKEFYLAGLEWMEEHGEVVYLPYTEGVSTTGIKRNILKNSYELISAELKREVQNAEKWKLKQQSLTSKKKS